MIMKLYNGIELEVTIYESEDAAVVSATEVKVANHDKVNFPFHNFW